MRFVTVLSNQVRARVFRPLIDNTSGVTAIEYGLIAVAAIVMITSVGVDLGDVFTTVASSL
jgi:Flp pilus assembly pilin Flp